MQWAPHSILLLVAPLCLATVSPGASGGDRPFCAWAQSEDARRFERDWYGRFLAVSIVSTVVCALTALFASLPVCCGCRREFPLKVVPTVLGVLAAFFMAIPMMVGQSHRDAYAHKWCVNCGCITTAETSLYSKLTFWEVVQDYNQGVGFLALVFGLATLILTCLSCCRCFAPLGSAAGKALRKPEVQHSESPAAA